MRLYNSLTKQVEEVAPQAPPSVSIYTCGPTVYDYPHIGNWFTFIRYDLLVRTLSLSGLSPKWAFNITDVGHLVSDADEGEDKLQKGARREGKTAQQIANFYSNYFIEGLERLNFKKPTYLPKATEHIAEQIDLISILEQKGFTYKIDDGIYYDTAKFASYKDFAKLDLDEQQAGARVDINPQKKQPADFALWKFSPKDQQRDMEWDSPWGRGFPGWHIECSAMIHKYFGDTVDIHSGGIDHIPVHHTNEIAQSQAVSGKPLALYWMHTNHIMVDDEKIAKSAGNGITLEDIETKGYSLQDLRLLVLQSHYRSQSKFNWDELTAAHNRLRTYRAMAALKYQLIQKPAHGTELFNRARQGILNHLQDDLNTPLVLAELSAISDILNEDLVSAANRQNLEDFIDFIDDSLGLKLDEGDISADQKELIKNRELARQRQDWSTADEQRQKLKAQAIEINDTAHGPIWYRT